MFQRSGPGGGDGLPHPRVKYDEEKFQISLDAQQYKSVLSLTSIINSERPNKHIISFGFLV